MTSIRSIRSRAIHGALITSSVLAGGLAPAFADADHPVRYLHLQNWKTPDGKSKSNMFTRNLTKGSYTYTQLDKIGGQTLTNNLCKLSSGTEGKAESANDIGNSADCPYQ